MLQQDTSNDYVCATGETHTVREFVNLTFQTVNIDIVWKGIGEDEKGFDSNNLDTPIVQVDPRYYRPTEVEQLLGDASKAKELLKWEPKISLDELIANMVEHDLENLGKF